MLDDEARSGFCIEAHQIRILAALYPGNVTHIRTRQRRKITRDIHGQVCKSHSDKSTHQIHFPENKRIFGKKSRYPDNGSR